MAEPKYAPARQWKRERRFAEAVRKVVNEQWSQARAAEYYGVSRPRLNEHVKRFREAHDQQARLEQAEQLAGTVLAGAVSPLGLNEKRRVGTFEEFDRRYFGHWVCPDCRVHHETPEFHRDIARACQDETTRVLINMPPYHSKSTNVTVKDTIYDICRDPNLRTLITSQSLSFARTFLQSINELLTNQALYEGAGGNLIKDWGPFKPEGESIWNRDQIYVAGRVTAEKDPTVQVVGVGGQVYGRRADKIKADDIATVENQKNPARVQGMLEWLDKELSSRIGRHGKLIYVGTRVHPGDIYSILGRREGYKVLRFPCILDEATGDTLWPDHFTYEMAVTKRQEMQRESDFQLVYQNIDVPGLGASFTEDIINQCKDTERVVGHFESSWRLIAGLDLAGGNAGSGYTAGVLEGIDLRTGKRFLVDIFNVKSMRAPQLKEQIFRWCDQYPIYEWRVENNGLQSNLVQYNEEIIRELARKNIRVMPHSTQGNKWDPQFGVESLAPLYTAEMISIPWANAPTARVFQQLVDQLVVFPMGMLSDVVMAHWFADIGCRDLLRRAHMPMFDARMKVPERIRRNRRVVDFSAGEVRRLPLSEQGAAAFADSARGYRRVVGRPAPQGDAVPGEPEQAPNFVNVAGAVGD